MIKLKCPFIEYLTFYFSKIQYHKVNILRGVNGYEHGDLSHKFR